MPHKIVLATGNQGKLRELVSLLADLPIEIVPQSQFDLPEAEETGTTFVENAIIKARHAAKLTGLPAIADDSGLAVNILKGAPGVYSARYAGESASDASNNQKLLDQMRGQTERQAKFLCVLVFMRSADDPAPLICQGEWHGQIAQQLNGDQGFGYDPLFEVPTLNCTAAQLTREQKIQLSHRGKALQQLIAQLKVEFA